MPLTFLKNSFLKSYIGTKRVKPSQTREEHHEKDKIAIRKTDAALDCKTVSRDKDDILQSDPHKSYFESGFLLKFI